MLSPTQLDNRLSSMAVQLDATLDQAKGVMRMSPLMCLYLPATLRQHFTELHGLGFSHSQVKSMCLRQPSLLKSNYHSQLNAKKWAFPTCVLQFSHDDVAACPHLLK